MNLLSTATQTGAGTVAITALEPQTTDVLHNVLSSGDLQKTAIALVASLIVQAVTWGFKQLFKSKAIVE